MGPMKIWSLAPRYLSTALEHYWGRRDGQWYLVADYGFRREAIPVRPDGTFEPNGVWTTC